MKTSVTSADWTVQHACLTGRVSVESRLSAASQFRRCLQVLKGNDELLLCRLMTRAITSSADFSSYYNFVVASNDSSVLMQVGSDNPIMLKGIPSTHFVTDQIACVRGRSASGECGGLLWLSEM